MVEIRGPVTDTPPTEEYGPEFSGKAAPKQPRRPPRSAKEVLDKLGTNQKVRSGIRKLTRTSIDDTPSDFDRLVARYQQLGGLVAYVHPNVGAALQGQAVECADNWFNVAEKNDSVRRGILATIEGGAWAGLVAAHAPILLAALPASTVEFLFMRAGGLFAQRVTEQTEPDPHQTDHLNFSEAS